MNNIHTVRRSVLKLGQAYIKVLFICEVAPAFRLGTSKLCNLFVFLFIQISVCISADNASIRLWKFMQRSVQSFLTSHGVQFGLENGSGTRVLDLDDDDDLDDGDATDVEVEGIIYLL